MKRKNLLLVAIVILCGSLLFSEEYSVFKKDALYGVINENREVILEPKYEWVSPNFEAFIAYDSDGPIYEIYDKSFKLIYSAKRITYTFPTKKTLLLYGTTLLNLETGEISDDFDQIILDSQFGFRDGFGKLWNKIVDIDGNVLLEDLAVSANTFSEGLIAVRLGNGKSGFVNTEGKFVIDADFNATDSDNGPKSFLLFDYYFNEGYALVEYKDKWYQYTKKGKKVELPENIELAAIAYSSGLIPVRDKETGKYGYMNPHFRIMIPYQFTEARSFVGPYAIVTYQGKDAIVDTKGNIYFCEDLE